MHGWGSIFAGAWHTSMTIHATAALHMLSMEQLGFTVFGGHV